MHKQTHREEVHGSFHLQEMWPIFCSGNVERMAEELQIPLLGKLPLYSVCDSSSHISKVTCLQDNIFVAMQINMMFTHVYPLRE